MCVQECYLLCNTIYILTWCILIFLRVEELTLMDILLPLGNAISSDLIRFNITRKSVWEGTERAMRRPNFLPSKTIVIKFTDDVGIPEGAIDQGGPKREFFRLVLEHICNYSGMFEGVKDEKMLSCNLAGNELENVTELFQLVIVFFANIFSSIFLFFYSS